MAAFLGVLVLLLAAGHVLRSSRWTYPFEKWAMYGNAEAPSAYNEFLIRDDAGPALVDIHRERTGRVVTEFDVYDVQRVPGSLEPGPRTLKYSWRSAAAGGS
jgi:hypothetical protein